MASFEGILGGLIFAGVGVFMFLRGLKSLRTAGRAADTAPSKVRSVAIGFAELKGAAEPNETLTAPFSRRPCMYYLCEIERYETSGSGKSRKTTWRTKWRGEEHAPFSLDDGTGSIPLKAEQAEFNCKPDKRWYLRPGSSFTVRKWRDREGTLSDVEPNAHEIEPNKSGSRRIGAYRFTERIIAPEEQIYVLGTVKRDGDVSVGLDRSLGPFVISDRKEAELLTHMRRTGIGLLLLGLLFAGAGAGFVFLIVIGA